MDLFDPEDEIDILQIQQLLQESDSSDDEISGDETGEKDNLETESEPESDPEEEVASEQWDDSGRSYTIGKDQESLWTTTPLQQSSRTRRHNIVTSVSNKSGRANLDDLWVADGTGVEYIRASMSLNRFRFILRCMRFDDVRTRQARREFDKLAPMRELFTDFVSSCIKYMNVNKYCTIDVIYH